MANAVEKLNTIAILDIEKVNTLTDDNIEKITTLEFVGDVIGEQSYTSAGSYTWVVPAGVTSVSVVSVQEGETPLVSTGGSGTDHGGGKGGDLRYQNNITVTPSSSISVVVGLTPTFNGSALTTLGGSGGAHTAGDGNYGAAGSGAGGYAGDGGYGTASGNSIHSAGLPEASSGGASAGYSGTQGVPAAGGGGVGLFGIGTTAANPSSSSSTDHARGGRGGSGGGYGKAGTVGTSNGTASDNTPNPYTGHGSPYHYGGGDGGDYGGGGGAEWDRQNLGSGKGGSGAIRIIWGTGRSFPSNAAAV